MARLRRVNSVFEQEEVGEEFIFLGSIADLVETEVPAGEWEVVLNGRVLLRELWEETFPSDEDSVLIHPVVYGGGGGGDDKAPARMALLIGVSIASMGVGAALGPTTTAVSTSVGMGTITTGSTFMAMAGMTATNIIGGMLVNKLLPYPETKEKSQSSLYSLNHIPTQQQGLPMPLWYGQMKLGAGNIISANKGRVAVNSTTIAETYDFICSYGFGPWESVDSISIPGALNAVKVEKDYRLGHLAQPDFGSDYDYTLQNHAVSLTPFEDYIGSALPYEAFTPTSIITFIMETTEVDKFDFDLIFSGGLYATTDGNQQSYWAQVNLDISVADTASWNGSTYDWKQVATETSLGNTLVEGSTEELTRATGRWSYGNWMKHYVATTTYENTDFDNQTPLAPVTRMVATARWVEFYASAVTDPNALPPANPNMITEHNWRYIAANEPIEKVNASTKITVAIADKTSTIFTAKFSGNINAAYPVTSYIFKLAFSRYSQYWASEAGIAIGGKKNLYSACSITLFNTYTDKSKIFPLTFPREVLVRINGTAESNVSSFLPEVNFRGRKVAVWNGSAWNFEYSSNPAWVCYDVLSQPLMPDGAITPWTTTSPALRYEGIEPQYLDYISFKAWADFCNEQVTNPNGTTETRYTFNGGFDELSSLWEAALAICGMSQAWLVWHGSEVQVVLDHVTASSQLFTVGNYVQDSVKETYLALMDRATAIEVEYMDGGKNWESNKFSLTESGYADSQKKVAIQLRGCTRASQAYRSAKIELLKNKHLKKTIEFQAPLNAITCTIGDVVEFQSSVGKYNWGGRIKSIVAPTVLQLDNIFTFDGAKTYVIRVIKESGVIVTSTLVTLSGTTDTITLVSGITVGVLDTYALGESNLVTEKIRVLDVSQTTDLLCTLNGIQYVEEIYDYNDADIVVQVHTPVADMPRVSIVEAIPSAYFDENKAHRSIISVSITKPSTVTYKHAKVYYKESSAAEWRFAGVLLGETFQFEVPKYEVSYIVAIPTVNSQDITMNIAEAPNASVTSALATLAACSSLTATPQYLATLLTWNHQNNDSVSSYELWMDDTNNRAGASQVYSGIENNAIVQIRHDLNYYLWIRPVDSFGNFGDWFPSSPTAGVLATSAPLQLDQIDEYNQTAPNPTSVSSATLS